VARHLTHQKPPFTEGLLGHSVDVALSQFRFDLWGSSCCAKANPGRTTLLIQWIGTSPNAQPMSAGTWKANGDTPSFSRSPEKLSRLGKMRHLQTPAPQLGKSPFVGGLPTI
jgi:hypothetical protein